MSVYSADEIADTILALAREQGIRISNLKLQKLIYYAQAWHLVLKSSPLFTEEFEAWVHGPVVPALFRRFKENRWSPIESKVEGVDDMDLRDFLKKILKVYGRHDASDLEALTHTEGPWLNARKGLAPDIPSKAVITRQSMKSYYTKSANEAR